MESMGTTVNNHVCEHFQYSRAEMYDIIKVTLSSDLVVGASG